MIPFLGRRRSAENRAVIERLNEALIAAVSQPAFYLSAGVPDTFNGRFELLVLHLALMVRRLRHLEQPGPAMAQDVVDTVFRNLDPALRELGVGDMGVPKRMKRLAEAFLGRSVAYDAALLDKDAGALDAALSRNVHGGTRPAHDLAAYARLVADRLEATDLRSFAAGQFRFPDPAVLVSHEAQP